MHIGIVAGEASGDILGADLIAALKKHLPSCQFSGLGGQRMLAQGFHSLYPQDRLAVMGFVEPLKRLPELLSIRKHLFKHFVEQGVDIVIGIDSPDFNLALEKKLREENITTVHYVSPSVWAWRQGRIKLIKQAVDHMLTLLPFEAQFYEKHQVPVSFVGHPLADQFPMENDTQGARRQLTQYLPESLDVNSGSQQDPKDQPLIACLPGSRQGEVAKIGPSLWQAMALFVQQFPKAHILVPALNSQRREQIEEQLKEHPSLPVTIIDGQSQTVMSAADAVVMASGTTTLEAMLLKKPMVVVYKKDAFSFWLISKLLKVDYISLPNLLADKALVPELLQDQASPEAISRALCDWLQNPNKVAELQAAFSASHEQLRRGASDIACDVILDLLNKRKA